MAKWIAWTLVATFTFFSARHLVTRIKVVLNVGNHKLTDNYVSSMGGVDNLMPIAVPNMSVFPHFYYDIVWKRT